MTKTAKLVMVSFMTRVIVEDSAIDEEILEMGRPRFIEKITTELGEHLESIEDDTECPYCEEFDGIPDPVKKEIVGRFIQKILPEKVAADFMDEVYDEEKCENDSIYDILNNAWWWHSGGESRNFHTEKRTVGDRNHNICYVIYDDREKVGNVILTSDEAMTLEIHK